MAAGPIGFAAAAASAMAFAQPLVAGLTLEAAIDRLEDAGLRVFYSSDVVRPTMRVLEQPAGADAREWLRALVAPHGLTIVPGPRDSVLIVRAEAPPASAVPHAPAEPAPPARRPLIEEIVVAASRYELARPAAGEPFRLESTDLEASPDLGDDSLRAVQRLPGAAANGFNARANIRGGEVDELLVRLDQLRLYDPYHLGDFQGIFSNIDPRIVSTMDVYTGGFPAAFGDRMSGVIDVSSLSPSAPRHHEIGVSFFNASILSAGLFAERGGEWLASLRRSNLDLLYNSFSQLPERPRYLDAFGKVAYRLTDSLRITMNVLYSRDDITLSDDVDLEESASSDHEDRYLWLRFEHAPSASWSGTTLVARTTLSGERNGTTAKPGVSTGWLLDRRDSALDTLQSDWTWQPASPERWSAQVGAALGRARGRYEYRDAVELAVLLADPAASQVLERERSWTVAPKGEQQALFGSVRWRPTTKLAIDVGTRWDRQTFDPGRSASLSPRIGLRYRVGERTFLVASGGRFEQAQAIHELQLGDGEPQYFAPQRSRHAVLGIEHELANGVQVRFEAYEKRMSRLRPRFENLLQPQTLLPELKPDRARIAPDSARARGLELLVQDGRAARLDWWASYSHGRVHDRLQGSDVLRSWDQTHAISGGLGWETPLWNVSLAAIRRSGWPRTAVIGLEDGDAPRLVMGPRNGDRVGAFHSLDIRVTRAFAIRRGELSAFLELTNALDRDNECCVEYEVELETLGEPMLGLSRLGYLPRVPSLGFVWTF